MCRSVNFGGNVAGCDARAAEGDVELFKSHWQRKCSARQWQELREVHRVLEADVLLKLTDAQEDSFACVVANDGNRHNCELAEKGR